MTRVEASNLCLCKTKLTWWDREVALVELAFCDESVAAIRFSYCYVFLTIVVNKSSFLQDDVLHSALHQAY